MSPIEHYLAIRPNWVPAADLVRAFQVSDRDLRSAAGKPGLCSSYAISSDKGYKHVRHATEEELKAFQARLRSHGQAEIDRADQLEAARNRHLQIAAGDLEAGRSFDKSGQGMLLT